MKRIAMIGLLGLLPLVGVQAADKDKAYAPKGAALLTCEGLTKITPNSPQSALVVGWFDGYLTALNMVTPETFDLAPWEDSILLSSLVLNYCTNAVKAQEAGKTDNKRPILVMDAVREVTSALYAKRLTQKSEMVQIKEGDKQGMIYAETLKQVQTALKEQGFFNGNADGKWGPKTRDAIKAFQKAAPKEANLQETGLPERGTLMLLLQPFGSPAAKK